MVTPRLSPLDRKMLRDLRGLWGQALAIALVIAAGVAMYVMSQGMLATLGQTRDAYYERQAFAHVFAPLKRAPNAVAQRLARLPGARRVETRIRKPVILDMPGLAEPAAGVVMSYPTGDAPALNRLRLVAGRWLDPARAEEALVSDAFAEAHGLGPGDGITVLMGGRKRTLAIAGVAMSPEYIYAIAPGALVPDNRRFGVLWMGRDAVEAAFDMSGAFNEALFTVQPGRRAEDLIAAADRVLEPHGGTGAFGREHQVSNWYVTGEMKQLVNMGRMIPPIFLGVAVFLLNIAIGRWVEMERSE
ncbi:MAG: ABC transporter permease, partial [Alphaproteobacteria bacterium]|nr:ABC transporter permease [Alphaproteobacteria bacterium]